MFSDGALNAAAVLHCALNCERLHENREPDENCDPHA